ncbi:ABC transporter ATP-binding protein [Parabacteroides sp. PF5-6]|uniref:ABC transporter ATP-binding protein n=1 Tax=Parabacteroides sp. PF5-6 TaxID=1742403 RepID=UPI0024072F02|nr:ABC transporter ATP-binding protein [Parabacteroides sp. PF5-6]MDF9830733.1 ABC-2 type transport system ATP-binding protein [Parabacteroides sp. PF5-6]
MYFLETEDVVKQFAHHRALDKVSIQVPQGKIFGLLGPNGAGKTTLIRIINRITAPDSGKVFFNGRESQPEDIYQIGYLPEERGLYKKMKVGEQAVYLAQLKGLPYMTARERLIHWFEKFDIMPWWNKKVEELSKGMQQKIQFVATVIHEPALLIFDEPFSGFDPINAELLKKEILELKEAGHTVIFSTHNMASVEEICDDIALINRSQVVLSGQVDAVRERYKTHNYTLRIKGNPGTLPAWCTVLDEKERNGITELRIHKAEDVGNSELLTTLAGQCELISFMEETPSMNDIFIKVVSESNSQES